MALVLVSDVCYVFVRYLYITTLLGALKFHRLRSGMAVKVRRYPLADGKRQGLYLDIYSHGQRTRESLGLYLVGDRKKDRDTLALA